MQPWQIRVLARVSVLGRAAGRRMLHVRDRVFVDEMCACGWLAEREGRLVLTPRGQIELAMATAALGGRRLPAKRRQLPLFQEV
jgi:hypothetical protein